MNLPNKPKVLAATHNPVSKTKMISFLVDFPTVLLAELRTHRILTQGSLYEHSELVDFNLSANSARAIPHKAYLQKVLDNPFIPIWTKQQKGMSGEVFESLTADSIWKHLLNGYEDYDLKSYYKDLIQQGVHKQNANRLLAPFAYTTCIISGTEWDNFWSLRCPHYAYNGMTFYSWKSLVKEILLEGDLQTYNPRIYEMDLDVGKRQELNKSSAQPEFQVIAEMLYDLYQESDWKESKYHIPFENEIVEKYDLQEHVDKTLNIKGDSWFTQELSNNIHREWYNALMKISASMCAKLSYNTQDNEDTLEKHLERANILIEYKHQEPFSHQAVAMTYDDWYSFTKTRRVRKELYDDSKIDVHRVTFEGDENEYKGLIQICEKGWCYNLRGFISQRYILENY